MPWRQRLARGVLRWPDLRLRTRLAALLVAASLLPLMLTAFIDVRHSQALLLDSTKSLLRSGTEQIARELDEFHRGRLLSVERIARFPEAMAFCLGDAAHRADAAPSLVRLLTVFPASDSTIAGAALLDRSGRVIAASNRAMSGANLSFRPYVQTALGGTTTLSDIYLTVALDSETPSIAYATPMREPDGQVACISLMVVRATAIWQRIRSSDGMAGPGSYAVLFDSQGIRIAHSSSDEIVFHPGGRLEPAAIDRLVTEQRFGKRTRELLEDVRAFPEQFDRARAADPDREVFLGFASVNQAMHYGVARRFETVPWTLFYMQPEATVQAQIARQTRLQIALALAIIAAASALGLLFARSIVRPVAVLGGATSAIAAGDLSARVHGVRVGELGQLADSFNTMADQIQAHAFDLQRSRDELDLRVHERTAELEVEIAERVRMESVLRERDAALHRAHVMTKLAHVITRPDGSFETWSETLPPLIGVLPTQMPQSTREWMTLLHPHDRPTFRGMSIAAGATGTRKDVEYRLRRADGSWIHLRQVIEPIPGPTDSDGRLRWFSTLQDVTEQKAAEEDLRKSEELLQAIIDNSAAVIYVKDLDGRYLLVNHLYAELFHVSKEAVVGKSDHELFAKEAADVFRAMDVRVATANAPLIEEEVVALDDGLHTYVSVKCPLRDPQGRLRGVFGISTDITDRKQAEAALRASEERTRLIVDTALDAVISIDPAGVITGWSPQAERSFGWTRTEVLGRLLSDTIVPPQHREAHRHGLERYLATGEAVVLNRRLELTAIHRDGREFPIELSITPIRTGDTVDFSAFVRDITERQLGESRLRAQLERLQLLDQITRAIGERQDLRSIYQVAIRSVEERLPVDFSCVCRYDAADNVLTVIRVGAHSQALALELAMDERSIIGIDQNGLSRCVQGELVHEPDIEASAFAFPQRLARGGLRSLVIAPLQSESHVFGVLIAARRLPDSFHSGECEFLRQLSAHVALAAKQAELHGSLQRAYDDLRQTQQSVMQQERLRALGEMASGITHDINNAISPIVLYTENLLEREPNLSARGRKQLQTIAMAIDDVAATVARLREFYRQHDAQAALQPVQLNEIVFNVVELTRARWHDMPQQRGFVVTLDIDPASGLPDVLGSEPELREALINLLFNAVDAMPTGGTLTLRTRRPAADGQPVLLEVADTGVGMDEPTRRRCLEPFFTTKGERGTGLGLAMVYGVVQRHGADIEIESAVGQGTTIRIAVPPAPGPRQPLSAPPPADMPAAPLYVLLVDDDPIMLKTLSDTLEQDGHTIVAASGGQAGIDAVHAARRAGRAFDAVITDLGMPYVDGRRVAAAVKEADSATPVIMLTGWGQRLAADGEIPAHVDQMLAKPPKLQVLRAALAQATRRGPGAS